MDTESAEFATDNGEALLSLIAERTGGQIIEVGATYAPMIPNERAPLWPFVALVGLGLFVLELTLRRLFVPRERRLAAGD